VEQKKKHNGFASGFGFILAAAGSAIGLGNLWSFPYKTSANGGAAFVILYVLCVLIIGVVTMVAELYIGKRAAANPITAYKKANKNLGWIGIFAIIIPLFIICYYSVLGGYTVKYSMNSFSGNAGIMTTFVGNIGEVILYTAIFMILAVIVVMAGIKGGIEKACKVLMPALFFILVALAVYSLCLGEGVSEGLNFYLNPDFSKIGFNEILAAMSQAFFSLSLGMGIMVSYGSYADKKINVGKSISMICIFDTLVALLAGLIIFPAVYHYKAVNADAAINLGGILLMFETLPYVFADMGAIGQIVSFFFFLMVAIAALTSVISLLEVVTQFVIQKFKIARKRAIVFVAIITFAVSIPIGISLGLVLNGNNSMLICGENWLDFFDKVTNTVLMPLGALGACVAIGWFLDKPKTFKQAVNPMQLHRALVEDGLQLGWFGKIFAVMVKYVTPLLILIVEVFGVKELLFTAQGFNLNGLGIVLTAYGLCIVCVIVYFIFFKNSQTGTNQDELKIAEKVEAVEEERKK